MEMARRRSGRKGDQTTGFADRIAAATRRDAIVDETADAPAVVAPGLTRYQRRTANLPRGAETLSTEQRTNIVINLRDQEKAQEE
jgi:hypothetical protein